MQKDKNKFGLKVTIIITSILSLVLLASPKLTQAAWAYQDKFGTAGSGAGQFGGGGFSLGAWDTAVSPVNGNIYVTDAPNHRVEVFSPAGVFLNQFGTSTLGSYYFDHPYGIAIDSTGSVYVVDYAAELVKKFDANGVYLSQFGGHGLTNGKFALPVAIAIDSSDNVYVANSSSPRVQKFNSSGVYQSQFGTVGTGNGQFSFPAALGISPVNGNIYVAEGGNKRVQIFDSTGLYVGQFGTAGAADGQFAADPAGLAFDSSGNVYVSDTNNSRVQVFSASGVFQTKFGANGTGNGQFRTARGLDIDSSGNIWVVDGGNNRVQKFSYNNVVFVTVTTEPASSIAGSSVVANGTITDLGGENASVRGFEYGTTASYGSNVTFTGSFSTGSFTANISSLSCNTDYHVRAFATNSAGTSYGTDQTFTTSACVQGVTTNLATGITTSSATLNGTISFTGGADATQSGFAYGTSANLTTGVSTSTLGSQTGATTFSSVLSSLTPGTTYFFRAYTVNSAGTSFGAVQSFTTVVAVVKPTVVTNNATSITDDSAKLNGAITAIGGANATQRGFAYSESANLTGGSVSTTTLGSQIGTGSFLDNVSGLKHNKNYYYRAYATNSAGTSYGAIVNFKTKK